MKPILLLTLLTLSSTVIAGDEKGNGGGAIVCHNGGGISSAQLLDLREAEKAKRNTLRITRSNAPYKEQLEAALAKYASVNPSVVELMREELLLLETENRLVELEDGKRLPPPTDTEISLLDEPRNCNLEGVARFNDDTEKLEIDPVIFNAMSETDKAALYFHEALYRVQRIRITKLNDSKVVRKITGKVFADKSLQTTPATTGIEDAISRCESEDGKFEFHIVPSKNDKGVELRLTKVDGLEIVEKTTFPIAPKTKLLENAREGFVLNRHRLSKSQSGKYYDGFWRGHGTRLFDRNDLYQYAYSENGLPLKIMIAAYDVLSNESDPDNGGSLVTAWRAKKPWLYENFHVHAALAVPGKSFHELLYRNEKTNSKLHCQ